MTLDAKQAGPLTPASLAPDPLTPDSLATDLLTTGEIMAYSVGDVLARAQSRLAAQAQATARLTGDHILNPTSDYTNPARPLREAAVLIPIINRGDSASVVLTLRTEHLPTHAGQIAFPGGKVDPGDADATAAALREAHEEIGLEQHYVEPVGQLHPYVTGSGFRIIPVLGLVREGFSLRPEPGEVADIFEVPLQFLMSPGNHQKRSRTWDDKRRYFYAIPYEDRYIWGVTAGIVRSLYDTLYG